MATEQPEPIKAILTGYWIICLKNPSSATVLLHCMWDGEEHGSEQLQLGLQIPPIMLSLRGTACKSPNHTQRHSMHNICLCTCTAETRPKQNVQQDTDTFYNIHYCNLLLSESAFTFSFKSELPNLFS